jgi:hypothetical protein
MKFPKRKKPEDELTLLKSITYKMYTVLTQMPDYIDNEPLTKARNELLAKATLLFKELDRNQK